MIYSFPFKLQTYLLNKKKILGDGFRGSRSAIDKAKLLAIAQKNAVKLLNSNDLKGKVMFCFIFIAGSSINDVTLWGAKAINREKGRGEATLCVNIL